jgi:stage V sporulation protein G
VEVTEVRIKLVEDPEHHRLKAFCSVTIDGCFVIRDIKVVEGARGLMVAMPSRKKTAHCPRCGAKVAVTAQYCEHCGLRLEHFDGPGRGGDSYVDIAHPITPRCRERLERRILSAYENELEACGLSSDASLVNIGEDESPKPDVAEESQNEEFGAGVFS